MLTTTSYTIIITIDSYNATVTVTINKEGKTGAKAMMEGAPPRCDTARRLAPNLP